MNADEAAKYISLSKSAIYKMTSQRDIPHFKRGGSCILKELNWMIGLLSTKSQQETK